MAALFRVILSVWDQYLSGDTEIVMMDSLH